MVVHKELSEVFQLGKYTIFQQAQYSAFKWAEPLYIWKDWLSMALQLATALRWRWNY